MPEQKPKTEEEELEELRRIVSEHGLELTADKPAKEKLIAGVKKKTFIAILTSLAVASVVAAFAFVRFIEPSLAINDAKAALEQEIEKASIVAVNSDMIPFKPDAKEAGEIPPGVNPKQLALAKAGELTEPAHFTFASELADENSHSIDVYTDFYSQRGRDFITINQRLLEAKIATGDIVLNVYPVLNEDAFSIYAPEALAEVFGTAPTKAWGFFANLMKDSIKLTGAEDASDIASFIATVAQANGGEEVD